MSTFTGANDNDTGYDMNSLARRYNEETKKIGRKVTRKQVKSIAKWVGA